MIRFISTFIILCFICSSASAFNLLCEGKDSFGSGGPEEKSELFLLNNTNEVISVKGFNYVRHAIKYISSRVFTDVYDRTVYDLYQVTHTDLCRESTILIDPLMEHITKLQGCDDTSISFTTTYIGYIGIYSSNDDSFQPPAPDESVVLSGGRCVKISDKLNEELMSFESDDLSKFITDKTEEEIKSFESSRLIEFIQNPNIYNLSKLY